MRYASQDFKRSIFFSFANEIYCRLTALLFTAEQAGVIGIKTCSALQLLPDKAVIGLLRFVDVMPLTVR